MDTPESSSELTGEVGSSHAIVRRPWLSGPGTDLWGIPIHAAQAIIVLRPGAVPVGVFQS